MARLPNNAPLELVDLFKRNNTLTADYRREYLKLRKAYSTLIQVRLASIGELKRVSRGTILGLHNPEIQEAEDSVDEIKEILNEIIEKKTRLVEKISNLREKSNTDALAQPTEDTLENLPPTARKDLDRRIAALTRKWLKKRTKDSAAKRLKVGHRKVSVLRSQKLKLAKKIRTDFAELQENYTKRIEARVTKLKAKKPVISKKVLKKRKLLAKFKKIEREKRNLEAKLKEIG